jgi:ATP-dependent RNA helicase RhlE
MPFGKFGLSPEILRAVQALNYVTPTPIQEQSIPRVLNGNDLLGSAQTGTGKTAAFALPILHRLAGEGRRVHGRRPIRSLVLTPTRELAIQIADSFASYGRHTGLRHAVVYGGVSQRPQEDALRKGVDLLVATPGRLLDLMGQGLIDLSSVEVFVLDEADRMLDMGFILDIRRIIEKLPDRRQTLMFSATMPPDIVRLADTILKDPARVAVAPVSAPAEAVEHILYYVEKSGKADLLRHLLGGEAIRNALVFTRTKHGADRVERYLKRADIRAEVIHGDKSQGARERALAAFKKGTVRVLVATDIAARGLDIVELSHVINYDLPNEPEAYVHRIGRTGRAGLSGTAISFCSFEERPLLADIERLIQKHLAVVADHPFASPAKPGVPTPLGTGRTPPHHRPYMIPVDATFLSAGRSAVSAAPDGSLRLSRHAGEEARPTSGPGGRKSGHRDVFVPSRTSRR